MSFDWFAFDSPPFLDLDLTIAGYGVALAYLVATAIIAARGSTGLRLSAPRWLLLAACTAAALILPHVLVTSSPARWMFGQPISPLMFLPVGVAAVWLGQTPAVITGLLTGLSLALFETGRVTQPFEIALLGALLAPVLAQRYRGTWAAWLRQPALALPLAVAITAWPLSLIGIFATGNPPAIASLEHVLMLVFPTLFVSLVSALAAGALLQAAQTRWPVDRPAEKADLIAAPWEEHLSQRLLFTLVPAATISIVLLVGVVGVTVYRVATGLVVEQMARDATTASTQIPFFLQTGHGLAQVVARSEGLVASADSGEQVPQLEQELQLEQALRSLPFFSQLVFVSAASGSLAASPEAEGGLSPEEAEQVSVAINTAAPVEAVVLPQGGGAALMSFITPAYDPQTGSVAGAVVGRTSLDENPLLQTVNEVLREGFVGSGEGYLIDAQGRILLYPAHPERHQETVELADLFEIPAAGDGRAYRQWEADGTRQLMYLVPVAGQPDWSVVVTVPNEVVLSLSLQIALPTLLVLLVLAAGALPLSLTLLHQITEPLEQLAQAADLMAEGQLEQGLAVSAENEVGRLGRAFDQMRLRLAQRLAEQERLLGVSRSVSSSLELFRAMPPILNSALDVTNAAGVRVALRRDTTETPQTYVAGEAAAAMAVLDMQLMDLVEQQGIVVISQLSRIAGSLDISNLDPQLKALVAVPLRSDTSFYGVLWLAYDHEHSFEQSELTFVSTLAGQAAVAVANARLFSEADEGRRRLEAVLGSTADGMIVVDNEGKVILINPAAEKYFNARAEQVIGKYAGNVIDVPELSTLMTDLQEPVSVFELPPREGKILLANTSTIVGHKGAIGGRVAVLRDVTALKQLDNLKTFFLRMVSHDLRSPLTYMRGWASMMTLSGQLNERQMEALDKINDGVQHIYQMTDRLTHLSRLQFGERAELALTLVDMEMLIREEVERHIELARQKSITIDVETDGRLPLILADSMLLGHAANNLIQNALKYTSERGRVTIRMALAGEDCVSVSVTDNGMGIRKEDQRQLFEAFYRVPQHEGDPPRPKGTGLGLALVKAIAEAHGGSVEALSEFGRGSTFTITIPIRSPGDF
jgi:PAS domain S-box-containing protein